MSAPTPAPNDSGIVLVLFCMMAALAYAVVSAVSLYAGATTHKRVKLLSGWANVGNACVHAFLILLLIVNQGG